MNSSLRHLSFVLVYLDGILIFFKTNSEREEYLNQVLQIPKDNHLHAKTSECLCLQDCTAFLAHILAPNGVRPSPYKIEAIKTWPTPKYVEALQASLDPRTIPTLGLAQNQLIPEPMVRLHDPDLPTLVKPVS
jgi:hypothetical protein